MYCKGKGVAKDAAKAARLYQKACDGGYEPGCASLGIQY